MTGGLTLLAAFLRPSSPAPDSNAEAPAVPHSLDHAQPVNDPAADDKGAER